MSGEKNGGRTPLNDIMIAMDVVDTLRHDEAIALRELNSEARRADLIKRLRDLYKGQGIDVPDRVLEEGVKALEEKRFAYDPPGRGWRRTLAEFYVTRMNWGKWLLGGLIGIAVVVLAWQLLLEQPRRREEAAKQIELTRTLPDKFTEDLRAIEEIARNEEIKRDARQLADDGRTAAKAGKLSEARSRQKQLSELLETLRQTFKIKIVQRRGELSGLWRIPKVNPNSRNYYLIVEGVDRNGRVIQRSVINEETGKNEIVDKWGVRVPRSVLESVQADKADDGIIQDDVVGEKRRGAVKPHWLIEVHDGALTRW
ncbi:MAG: DUF6384 family protein [Hyphomicrobiaceae bacterium]